MPQSAVAELPNKCMFNFIRNCEAIYQSDCLVFHSYQPPVGDLVNPHLGQDWYCWFFFFFLINSGKFSFLKIYLFIYLFWLCWVFVSVRGLSLVAASGGHSSLWCAGLSLSRPLLLRSTGSRRAGSVVVAHGPSCSTACGIFPDQGSNPCPLH